MRKSKHSGQSLKPIILIASAVIVGFVTIYNFQYGDRWGGNIFNIFTSDKAAEFIYKGATEENTSNLSPGEDHMKEIGRLDSIILPIKILSKEGVQVLYGVGIGNASRSFSDILVGEYSKEAFGKGGEFTTVSTLLWGTGIIGVFFSFTLLLMIFYDSLILRHNQDYSGAIALGWLGVVPIIALSMIYTNLLDHNVIGYLMWFFNGYIISKAKMKNDLLVRI